MELEKELKVEQELQFLFYYKGNIELYHKIEQFISENIDFDQYKLRDGVTKEDAISVIVLDGLNKIIFPLLHAVYLFHDDHLKCLKWIKGTLKRYSPPAFTKLIITIALEGLNDESRFQKEIGNLAIIRKKISEFDYLKLESVPDITCDMFEYFADKNPLSDFEKWSEGFFAVRGLLKTEADITTDFIKENRSEILKHFRAEIEPLFKNYPLSTFQEAEIKTNDQNSEIKLIAKKENDIDISNLFDYSNKENYFFADKIESFKTIENILLQNGYLSSTGIWDEEQNKLVAFIHILYKLHYLRPGNTTKQRIFLNKYKRFFIKRYSIDISKAFQPTQFKIGALGTYKPIFHFIPNIDNL